MIRAADYLALAAKLPEIELGRLTGGQGVVVVAPHPDDESLGCGGLIAACCAHKIAVRLVVLSDGTGSHPNSQSYPAARLCTVRESEVKAAASMLGLPEPAITCLRLRDGSVPVAGPLFARAAAVIRDTAIEIGAASVVVTWRHDPHCDHQAAFAIAQEAMAGLTGVRLLAYPIWGWDLPADAMLDESAPKGGSLAIGPYLDRKRAAIGAHRSQISALIDDDPAGFRLAPEMLARFDRAHEIFIECPA